MRFENGTLGIRPNHELKESLLFMSLAIRLTWNPLWISLKNSIFCLEDACEAEALSIQVALMQENTVGHRSYGRFVHANKIITTGGGGMIVSIIKLH